MGRLAIILLSVVVVLAPTPAAAAVTYEFQGVTFDGRLEVFCFTVPISYRFRLQVNRYSFST